MAKSLRWMMILAVICSLTLVAVPVMAKTLKVGVMGPFTGPSAKAGKEFKDSVQMVLDKIGGKIGDYQLEIVWVDSQSDPAKATSAFAEACERKGIVAGAINWHSSVAIACMDLAAQYKVPWMFGMGAAQPVVTKWRENPKKYNYWGVKGWPVPGGLEAKGMAAFLDDLIKSGQWKPKAKKLAIFGEETDWGRNSGENIKKQLGAAGWEIVSEDYFDLKQTDFYPLLAKYKKAGVTFIGGTTTSAPSMTALVKQYAEVGLNKQALLFANGLSWVGDWYKLVGKSSNGVLDVQTLWSTKAAQDFAAAKEKKFGYKPSAPASGLSYDGFTIFVTVLKRTLERDGKLDSASIHKTLVDEVYTGKMSFTAKDGVIMMKEYKYTPETNPDPVLGPDHYFFPVTQYRDGGIIPIYPAGMASGKFIAP